MNGRWPVIMLLGTTAVFGAALWYFQGYAYYDEASEAASEMRLTRVGGIGTQLLATDEMRAIDAPTSPIKFRACFATTATLAMLTETYEVFDAAEPLVAPGWFDCFDAGRLSDDLRSGAAVAFMGERDVVDGADLIIAVYPDGRAYAWHQLNDKYTER